MSLKATVPKASWGASGTMTVTRQTPTGFIAGDPMPLFMQSEWSGTPGGAMTTPWRGSAWRSVQESSSSGQWSVGVSICGPGRVATVCLLGLLQRRQIKWLQFDSCKSFSLLNPDNRQPSNELWRYHEVSELLLLFSHPVPSPSKSLNWCPLVANNHNCA